MTSNASKRIAAGQVQHSTLKRLTTIPTICAAHAAAGA